MKKISPLKIKARTIERGLKLKDLAAELNISKAALSNRIGGQSSFTANELGTISVMLGCSIDDFYNNDSEGS